MELVAAKRFPGEIGSIPTYSPAEIVSKIKGGIDNGSQAEMCDIQTSPSTCTSACEESTVTSISRARLVHTDIRF